MVFENFSKDMQKLIKEKGFLEPTLAQKISAKHIIGNRNVLLIAPTGLGKTESALLPIIDKIHQEKSKPISVLYITPMRSLNRNLLDRLFWWCDKLDLEISVRHGDTTQAERAMQRENPSDIMITTPETLNGILPGKRMREHLKNVKYVVIDEIHELIGSKRGVQLSIVLERLAEIAGDFQRIALSATVGEPEKVAKFLGKNVKILRAEAAKNYKISVELPRPDASSLQLSEKLFLGEETTARLMKIKELIDSHRSVITFTNTRQTAEVLSSRFKTFSKGIEVHHGSLSKESRVKAEKDFKDEKLKALIATSSLELGIDIGSIDYVIQYLSPRQVSRLIQRIGRGGHKVGETSEGVIITGDEDSFESSVIGRKAMGKELEDIKVHDGALDVMSTQIIGMCLDEYGIGSEKVYNMIKKAYPYRNLTKKQFLDVLRFLGMLKMVWIEPDNKEGEFILKRSKKGWQYFYDNLSMIPDTRQKKIVSIVEGEPIGSLDETFIAEHGEPGKSFVCNGRAWRVIQVDEKKVLVEPIDNIESAIPAWEGELIPVPYSVAKEVGELRRTIKEGRKLEYPIDKNTEEEMRKIIEKQGKSHIIPDDKIFLLENYKDFIILHSCSGTLINSTIGRYVAAKISEDTGVAVNIKTDPYRIIFQTLAKGEKVIETIMKAEDLKETLEKDLERSSMFKYRFINVAKRFGIISRKARFDRLGMNKIITQYYGSPAYEETLRELFLEKMDVEGAERVLQEIKEDKIKIITEKGLSHLGENGLIQQFSEVMKPRRPEREIFDAFKNRLMHTRLRLVCTNCADYALSREVKDIEERPHCPKCKSSLIGITSVYKKEPLKVLKNNKKKLPLKKEEEKDLNEIRRSSDLMVTYGNKYAMTQAGRGVGTETAARILAKLPDNEDKLLKLIFNAEKEFAKNRIYWK